MNTNKKLVEATVTDSEFEKVKKILKNLSDGNRNSGVWVLQAQISFNASLAECRAFVVAVALLGFSVGESTEVRKLLAAMRKAKKTLRGLIWEHRGQLKLKS